MRIARWVPVVALLSSVALLGGCGLVGGSSNNSGSGLAITTAALPDATVSQSYSGSLQATGGATPYSWSLIGGSLPTGLSMSTSGQITGTPSTMGNYAFQTQVTDATNRSSSTNFSIQVTGPTPSITSVSPQYGSISGGTTVTISGKNLQSGATVTFGGDDATSTNVIGPSQMTAITPPHAAGSVNVTVMNPGGKSGTLPAGFGYGNAAPSASAISPNSGPTAGGTTVKITGANFVFGAIVLFAGVQASSIAVTSPTQIQAVSPAGTAGTVDVSVRNPDGQTATLSGAYTYGSDPPSSLLTGCTLSSGNVLQGCDNSAYNGLTTGGSANGWTIAAADGFDDGALANSRNENLNGVSIECTFAHTGSCAIDGHTSTSNTNYQWNLNAGVVGTSHDVYISWWDYTDNYTQSWNGQYRIAGVFDSGGKGSSYLDRQSGTGQYCRNGIGPGSLYECQSAQLDDEVQCSTCNGIDNWGPAFNFINRSWKQFEIHFKANTVTTPITGLDGNGELDFYVNGQLVFQKIGNINYYDMTGMKIRIGGYYGTLKGTDSTGTTCENPTTAAVRSYCVPFTACSPCPIPSDFTRYMDDIIVLKK